MAINGVNNRTAYASQVKPKNPVDNKKAQDKKTDEEKDLRVGGYISDEQAEKLEEFMNEYETSDKKMNQDMGKDQFMHILLTQLTHQNPLEPLKDQEFIAQMAQFSALEELKTMGKTLSDFQASLDSIRNAVVEDKLNEAGTSDSEKLDKILEELKNISEALKSDKAKKAYE